MRKTIRTLRAHVYGTMLLLLAGCSGSSLPEVDRVFLSAAGNWDRNRDGVVTCDEWRAYAAELFDSADTDKGRLEVVGDGPKGGFKGPRKPQEMVEEIRRAAQEAPAAIDRQRLPPAARKMARGYFEKMRGQGEKDGKKP